MKLHECFRLTCVSKRSIFEIIRLAIGLLCNGFSMTKALLASVMTFIVPFIGCQKTFALSSNQVIAQQNNDICVSTKIGLRSTLSSNLKAKFERTILNDPVKVHALSQALSMACRSDGFELSQTLKYQRLKELLRLGREEYEGKGAISIDTLMSLAQEVGVIKEDVKNSEGKIVGWQLVIDKKAKDEMRIKNAVSLASRGYLLIEPFHQLSRPAGFEAERAIVLAAIERTAKAILDSPDENDDGRFGWGRVWFKGRDGLLLHTTVPAQNMYFAGTPISPASIP